MSAVFSVRVSDELADWFERSAAARGVRKSRLLEAAIVLYMEKVEAGWEPSLPEPTPPPWGRKVTLTAYVPGEAVDDDVEYAAARLHELLGADDVAVRVKVEKVDPREPVREGSK